MRVLTLGIMLLASPAFALPWLQTEVEGIHTVHAVADVTVSDGSTYTATSVYHDPQRAVFRIEYPDRTNTMGVAGRYFWTFDGELEAEGPPFVERFVLGHQIHAQILFFDRIHAGTTDPAAAEFDGRPGFAVASADTHATWRAHYGEDGLRGMVIDREPEADIVMTLDDWQDVDGTDLPFEVVIDDGERVFTYRYSRVALNKGSLGDFQAPTEVLTDEQRLLRMHRHVMDDHFFGRTDHVRAQRADTLVMANAGEVSVHPRQKFDAMFETMMGNRDYTLYDDLIRPRIEISDDGTLATVTVQVRAEGVRLDDRGRPTGPLGFTCAWLSTYRKVDGAWKLTGNISNFLP